MTGEDDLDVLCCRMSPSLHATSYVYCCVQAGAVPPHVLALALGTFQETEGMTLILPRDQARAAGLVFDAEWALVTLQVHSSLEAVGFIAAVSQALAQARVPCNVVSAYYHDHLLIPFSMREQAMQVLGALTLRASGPASGADLSQGAR